MIIFNFSHYDSVNIRFIREMEMLVIMSDNLAWNFDWLFNAKILIF